MDPLEEVLSGLALQGRPASVTGEGPARVIEFRTGVRYAQVSLKNGALAVAFFESPTTMAARKSAPESAARAIEQIAAWVPAAS